MLESHKLIYFCTRLKPRFPPAYVFDFCTYLCEARDGFSFCCKRSQGKKKNEQKTKKPVDIKIRAHDAFLE